MNIRKAVGWLVASAFRLSGSLRRHIRLYDRPGSVLSIVGHDPTPGALERVVTSLLGNGFTFISADDYQKLASGAMSWKPRLVWLSFDDGWASFKSVVLPIAEKHRIPITLFIAPRETEIGQVWTNAVMEYITDGELRAMYALPLDEREARVGQILAKRPHVRMLMTKDEVIEVAAHPLVTIGNHTNSHLSCSHRPVPDVVEEVRMAGETLRDWLGYESKLVCYPFGHYTNSTNRALVDKGLVPIALDPGVTDVKTMGKCRNVFYDDMTNAENLCRIFGAWVKVTVTDK